MLHIEDNTVMWTERLQSFRAGAKIKADVVTDQSLETDCNVVVTFIERNDYNKKYKHI